MLRAMSLGGMWLIGEGLAYSWASGRQSTPSRASSDYLSSRRKAQFHSGHPAKSAIARAEV